MSNTLEKSVFSILYQGLDQQIRHIGTGFLINKKGLFITAGHVFRLKEVDGSIDLNNFRACFLFDDKHYVVRIKSLIYESIIPDKQRQPSLVDYAIGELIYDTEEYLILDRRQPYIRQELMAITYENTSPEKSLGNDFSNLKQLDRLRLEKKTMPVMKPVVVLKNRNPADRPYNKYITFLNCSSLKGVLVHTNSGSPIIDSNMRVRGILIGKSDSMGELDNIDKHYIIMLRSKFLSKRIQFSTHYIYNPFEYLVTE